MPLSYKTLSQPIVEPVSLSWAKQQVVVDSSMTADDNLIDALIVAARQYLEKKTNRAFFNRPMQMTMDYFPYPNFGGTVGSHHKFPFFSRYWEELAIKLVYPSCVEVTNISYLDQNGDTVVLDPSTYTVDINSEPARIFPTSLLYWPWCANFMPGNVLVNWVAGTYGDGVTVNTCPQTIRQAMLLLISHWYSNRDATATTVPKAIEMGVDALISGEVFETFGWEI
jgi:uncharacterized phiE125 gp8 family phage protein